MSKALRAKVEALKSKQNAWLAQREAAKEARSAAAMSSTENNGSSERNHRVIRSEQVGTNAGRLSRDGGSRDHEMHTGGGGSKTSVESSPLIHNQTDQLEQVFARVIEAQTSKLREELLTTLGGQYGLAHQAASSIQGRVEAVLEEELVIHSCPACGEVFTPSGPQSPLLLAPCGHSLCGSCWASREERNLKSCPSCKSLVETAPPNRELARILGAFAAKARLPHAVSDIAASAASSALLRPSTAASETRSESLSQPPSLESIVMEKALEQGASEQEAASALEYARKWSHLSVRTSALSGQAEELNQDYEAAATRVMIAEEKTEKSKQAMMAAEAALQAAIADVEEAKKGLMEAQASASKVQERLDAVQESLEPLEVDMEKCAFLVEGIAGVDLAELDAEMQGE